MDSEELAKALKSNPESLNQKKIILGIQLNDILLNGTSKDSINCFVDRLRILDYEDNDS